MRGLLTRLAPEFEPKRRTAYLSLDFLLFRSSSGNTDPEDASSPLEVRTTEFTASPRPFSEGRTRLGFLFAELPSERMFLGCCSYGNHLFLLMPASLFLFFCYFMDWRGQGSGEVCFTDTRSQNGIVEEWQASPRSPQESEVHPETEARSLEGAAHNGSFPSPTLITEQKQRC